MNESKIDQPIQVPFVFANDEWIPLKSVEFLNVEEGIFGEDIVTFLLNNKIYKSKVILKYE